VPPRTRCRVVFALSEATLDRVVTDRRVPIRAAASRRVLDVMISADVPPARSLDALR
jgi:hypothetical protein